MSKYGEVKLPNGWVVNLVQQAYNDNDAQGNPAWFAAGYLSTEDPDDDLSPTVSVRWASKGAVEAEDDADWDNPVSVNHYRLGELL